MSSTRQNRLLSWRIHRARSKLGGQAMSKTVVLLGTRKGAFLLESDEARRD